MTGPIDRIREGIGRPPGGEDALAALTEVEQQLAEDRSHIFALQAQEAVAAAEAAERQADFEMARGDMWQTRAEAAETALAERAHRCQFPACVDGNKPEFCGNCGDAERAVAAEQRANALADALRTLVWLKDGDRSPTYYAAKDAAWYAARAALDRHTHQPETPCSVCGSYGHFTHRHTQP